MCKANKNFRENMLKWALKWVSGLAFPIVENINELEKDKTLVSIVNKWAELDADYERARLRVLERLSDTNYDWYKGDMDLAKRDYDESFEGQDTRSYSEVINYILSNTYKLY